MTGDSGDDMQETESTGGTEAFVRDVLGDGWDMKAAAVSCAETKRAFDLFSCAPEDVMETADLDLAVIHALGTGDGPAIVVKMIRAAWEAGLDGQAAGHPAADLLPCPFCSHEPLVYAAGRGEKTVVACHNPNCGPGPRVLGHTGDLAAQAWNDRAPDGGSGA